MQADRIDEVTCATRDKLSKANHALLELSKVRPVKEEETGDDNVPIPAVRLRIPSAVQGAMIVFSLALHERPELQDRFLLRIACILHACMPTGEPSGQHSQQHVCGQALNALLELFPFKVKIEENMEQQEFLCHLPSNRVCSQLQRPFTELTMAWNENQGLTNDVVRHIAHLMSTLVGKSKDRMHNEQQRLAANESSAQRKDTAIKLAIAARDLGGGAGGGNAFQCNRKRQQENQAVEKSKRRKRPSSDRAKTVGAGGQEQNPRPDKRRKSTTILPVAASGDIYCAYILDT